MLESREDNREPAFSNNGERSLISWQWPFRSGLPNVGTHVGNTRRNFITDLRENHSTRALNRPLLPPHLALGLPASG